MAIASYDNGDDSYVVLGQPDPRLQNCVIVTEAEEAKPVVEEYALAGLSGRGTNAFGLDALSITWDMSWQCSAATLQAIEADIREHLRAPVRGTLKSEAGEQWLRVELRGYKRTMRRPCPAPLPAQGLLFVRAKLTFRWMQP